MSETLRTHTGTAAAVVEAIKDYTKAKSGDLNAESTFSDQYLSGLITWICLKTQISIVGSIPKTMTIREIVEMFQKAAGV